MWMLFLFNPSLTCRVCCTTVACSFSLPHFQVLEITGVVALFEQVSPVVLPESCGVVRLFQSWQCSCLVCLSGPVRLDCSRLRALSFQPVSFRCRLGPSSSLQSLRLFLNANFDAGSQRSWKRES